MLSRSEQRKSVRDAYAIREGVPVDKQRILLVDDVLKDGATLIECKKARAAAVMGVTVGRVDTNRMASSLALEMKAHLKTVAVEGRRQHPYGYERHLLGVKAFFKHLSGDAKAAQMENRLKIGLRPRPNIGLGGTVADSVVSKLPCRPSLMQAPVLVLNATFEPINVTAVRRALVLMLKGVAQAEETNHAEVHTTSRAVQVPSVIRLLSYRHIPQQSRALSRKNILLRDRNTCQFCGTAFPAAELTLDHVMPRSRGGRSSWENLVACCYSCNNHKGDRTPEEAGLKLQRRPRPFTLHTSRQLMRLIGHRDEKWRKYLFY